MPLHRYVSPTYFGGLPGTHDLINVVSGGTGAGGSAPADAAKGSGPNVGTYFVAFGEDATSADANRPARALAENTDFLDDVIHRNLAIPTVTSSVVAGSSISSLVLAGDVFVGLAGSPNDAITRSGLVRVTDVNGIPLHILTGGSYQEIAVTLIHDGSSNNVIGNDYHTNPTVDFSPSIPAGQTYRLAYYVRGNVKTQPDGLVTSLNNGYHGDAALWALAQNANLGSKADPTAWFDRAISVNDGGGLGNIADSSFGSTTEDMQTLMDAVDELVARRRTRVVLSSDASGRTGDIVAQDAISQAMAGTESHGPFLLSGNGSAALEFQITASFPTNRFANFLGETSNGTYGGFTHVEREGGGVGDYSLYGTFENISFGSRDASDRLLFGGGGRGSFHLESCGINPGNARLDGSAYDMPWSVRNTVCSPDDFSGLPSTGNGLEIVESTAGSVGHGLVENCLIESRTTTTGSAIAVIDSIGVTYPNNAGLSYAAQSKPITFRNVVFRQRLTFQACMTVTDCSAPLTFENCIFYNTTGNLSADLVYCSNSHVNFHDCLFLSECGGGVRIEDCHGTMSNSKIVTGSGSVSGGRPQALSVSSTTGLDYNLRDVEVWLGSGSFTNTQSVEPTPCVLLGETQNGTGPSPSAVHVDNLRVFVSAATMGVQPVLALVGMTGAAADFRMSTFRNIRVDFNEADMNANPMTAFGGFSSVISASGDMLIGGFAISRWKMPSTDHLSDTLFRTFGGDIPIEGFDVHNTVDASGGLESLVRLSGSRLSRAYVETGGGKFNSDCILTSSGTDVDDLEVVGGMKTGSVGATIHHTGGRCHNVRCTTILASLRAFLGNTTEIISNLSAFGSSNMTIETARVEGTECKLYGAHVECVSQSSDNCLRVTGTDSISNSIFVKNGPFLHDGTGAVTGTNQVV